MRVVHAMTKPVTSRMGRLGRSWPSSQARQSQQVVNFRQTCSAGLGIDAVILWQKLERMVTYDDKS